MFVRPYDRPTLWSSDLMIVWPYDRLTLWLSDLMIVWPYVRLNLWFDLMFVRWNWRTYDLTLCLSGKPYDRPCWWSSCWWLSANLATLPGGICTQRHDRMKTTLCIASRNTKHSRLLRTDFLVHLSSARGNIEQLIADSNIVRFGNKASDARKNSNPASCC